MAENRKIAFVTLGCKLNFSESSTFAREFHSRGYEIVRPVEAADVYVVNSCSVTEHADKKCRNIVRKLHKISPDAMIAVCGCYAQLKPDEILGIEGVGVVVGAQRKGDLPDLVEKALSERAKCIFSCDISQVEAIFPAYSSGERTRSFLKVQDGCDYKCSYCTIPLARGCSRNLPVSTLVNQANEIAEKGIKEIVLTGVNIGDFGRTTGESFLDLLKALNDVRGIERYRISSIEPNLLTDEIIEWVASGTKFLPHFHIPVQSGCDRTLRAMRRRYTSQMFEEKIALVRDKMESEDERFSRVFFGIDVIAGFPGETDEDFEQTYALLERVRPAFLHIFPYSRRADTPAALRADQVQDIVKTHRVERLEALSDRLHEEFTEANRGRRLKVLFESTERNGTVSGYTENYLKVERAYDSSIIGQIEEIVF